MATPVFRVLRNHWPDAEIVVEGAPFLKGLLDGLTTVDRFLPDSGRGWKATRARARRLAAESFDLALLLPDSARAAFGPFLARVPNRVGYARDPLRRLCLSLALKPPMQDGKRLPIPMTERYMAIPRALGCTMGPTGKTPPVELAVSPEAVQRVSGLLSAQGFDPGRPFVVGAPGANFGASKLYPSASFASACDGIVEQLDLGIVLAPAPSEVDLALDVASQMKHAVTVLDSPPTSLEELKALISLSELVLSNDTGPRHMAVALDTPTVVTMGPTDPRHTDYQMNRQRVLREEVDCSPCHKKECPIDHRCMTRLAPARVVQAAQELLDQSALSNRKLPR